MIGNMFGGCFEVIYKFLRKWIDYDGFMFVLNFEVLFGFFWCDKS